MGASTEEPGVQRPASWAKDFENLVLGKLSDVFGGVEVHKTIEGFSGTKWKVDFLVGSNFIIEASVQRRLETKIDSTFLKFIDISKRYQNFRAALVFEELHVGHHHSLNKKFFPTSEYRTMISHGFPILTPQQIPRLPEFQKGTITSSEASSRPEDFNLRSLFTNRMEVGKEILKVLAQGPLTRHEIAKMTGRNPFYIVDVIQTLPQVKKLSCYYALSEELILKRLLGRKGRLRSPIQRRLVADFLRTRFLQTINERGHCRTRELAAELCLHPRSFAQLIHQLSHEGVIRRKDKGVWEMATPTRHEMLFWPTK